MSSLDEYSEQVRMYLREVLQAAQEKPKTGRLSASARLGLWLATAVCALLLVITLVAWAVIDRSERAMAMLLAEKGASLLTVFESALRTGMRDGSSGLVIQALMEEMTQAPDLEFVAVTMPDGVIIAHSGKYRIGELLRMDHELATTESVAELDPQDYEQWRIMDMEGKHVFVLYRHFTMGRVDWPDDVPEPIIFVGLEISPFEITNSQNRRYIAMLSVVLLLVGLACMLAVWYAQAAAESRKRQRNAESRAQKLEAEMQRKEKLAAVGTLAAGVAHEIRNPLSSIKGYATYFRDRFPKDSEDREAAIVMMNEVNRLNRVITDLLALSTPARANLKPVQLELVVNHVLRLIRPNAAQKNVTLSFRKASALPPVMADMERLSQALLNLCINALDAMPNGGLLEIALAGGKEEQCLIVRDTGQGIPEDVLKKIFDPYFTTKGSGTGLGLPTVHKIIQAHNGHLEVESRQATQEQPGGTTFRIWLPLAREAQQ